MAVPKLTDGPYHEPYLEWKQLRQLEAHLREFPPAAPFDDWLRNALCELRRRRTPGEGLAVDVVAELKAAMQHPLCPSAAKELFGKAARALVSNAHLSTQLAEAKAEIQAWVEQSQKQCDLRKVAETRAEALRGALAALRTAADEFYSLGGSNERENALLTAMKTAHELSALSPPAPPAIDLMPTATKLMEETGKAMGIPVVQAPDGAETPEQKVVDAAVKFINAGEDEHEEAFDRLVEAISALGRNGR